VADSAGGFDERTDKEGKWEAVKTYQVLYKQSEIRCGKDAKDDATLSVRYFHAGERVEDVKVPCAAHRDKPWAPAIAAGKSVFSRAFLAAAILFGSRPDFYGLTLSRGSEELVDAIGAVSDGKLDMGAALAELPHGTYFVQLCRVEPDPEPCASPREPIPVDWAGESAFVPVPAEQGEVALYRVRRFRRERRWRAESDEVWLLSGSAAKGWAVEFEEFKKASEPLAESYGPAGIRALRRAYIHRLALGAGGQP
jgi:hypothetical protein